MSKDNYSLQRLEQKKKILLDPFNGQLICDMQEENGLSKITRINAYDC